MALLQTYEREQDLSYQPGKGQNENQSVMNQWWAYLQHRYPGQLADLPQLAGEMDLETRLKRIDWHQGDADRGQKLFTNLKCARCHDQGSRIGPSLKGIGQRFSMRDIFLATASPSLQISDRYASVIVQTTDGQLLQGVPIYDSVDGLTLMDADGKTIRLNQSDIDSRRPSKKLMMPDGLLDDASDQDWSDLYAFLRKQ